MTAAEVRKQLQRRVSRDGLRATARELGVNHGNLHTFLKRGGPPPKEIIEALDLVVIYNLSRFDKQTGRA